MRAALLSIILRSVPTRSRKNDASSTTPRQAFSRKPAGFAAGAQATNACLGGLLLAACTVGPDYRRPEAVGVTGGFKEAPPGWTVAQPQDAAHKGAWWEIYHDPVLNRLE